MVGVVGWAFLPRNTELLCWIGQASGASHRTPFRWHAGREEATGLR